ncbi:MAG: tol-pal system YbgF family protein [Flavobacteriales bacterium]
MSENTTTPTSSGGLMDRIQDYVRTNRKWLTIGGGALVVLVGGYIYYQKQYVAPKNKKAQDQLWKADYYFEIDSFKLAANGDAAGMPGYKMVTKKYGSTSGGNLASYCLGICYLNTGDYKNALKSLEDCSFDDDLVGSIAIGSQGDALMELNKVNDAIEKYEEAANRNENDFTTPLYLKKAAFGYEQKGQYKKAAEIYERIFRDFEHTTEGRDIEKYLARAKNLGGK